MASHTECWLGYDGAIQGAHVRLVSIKSFRCMDYAVSTIRQKGCIVARRINENALVTFLIQDEFGNFYQTSSESTFFRGKDFNEGCIRSTDNIYWLRDDVNLEKYIQDSARRWGKTAEEMTDTVNLLECENFLQTLYQWHIGWTDNKRDGEIAWANQVWPQLLRNDGGYSAYSEVANPSY